MTPNDVTGFDYAVSDRAVLASGQGWGSSWKWAPVGDVRDPPGRSRLGGRGMGNCVVVAGRATPMGPRERAAPGPVAGEAAGGAVEKPLARGLGTGDNPLHRRGGWDRIPIGEHRAIRVEEHQGHEWRPDLRLPSASER